MKSKNNEPRQIRYHFHMKWALGLRKAEFRANVNDNVLFLSYNKVRYSKTYSTWKYCWGIQR